jgi:hypothetical protein
MADRKHAVWAGVVVRFDDGTLHAYEIDRPTDGRVTFEHEWSEPAEILGQRHLMQTTIEIVLRGLAVPWQAGQRLGLPSRRSLNGPQ